MMNCTRSSCHYLRSDLQLLSVVSRRMNSTHLQSQVQQHHDRCNSNNIILFLRVVVRSRSNTGSSCCNTTRNIYSRSRSCINGSSRNLSTKRWLTTTTSPMSSSPITQIISRRVYLQQQQQFMKGQNKKVDTTTTTTKAKTESTSTTSTTTSWPKSIQIMGYFGMFVVGPYFTIWYLVNHEKIRDDSFFPVLPKYIQDVLRNHYGEKDYHTISYYDYLQTAIHTNYDQAYNSVPSLLWNEPNHIIRQQQENITEYLQNGTVTVRVHHNNNNDDQHYSQNDDDMNTNFVTVPNIPAGTPSDVSVLRQVLFNNNNNEQKHPHPIAIDFPVDDHHEHDIIHSNIEDNTISSTFENNNNSMDFSSLNHHHHHEKKLSKEVQVIPSLSSMMNVYSLWYYQNPLQIKEIPITNSTGTTNTTASTTTTKNRMNNQSNTVRSSNSTSSGNSSASSSNLYYQIQGLEYEIKQLQNEMKNGSLRAMDDIMDEIQMKKTYVRTLKKQYIQQTSSNHVVAWVRTIFT